MKKEVRFEYEVFSHIQACPDKVQQLYNEAQIAKNRAYAPYSNFQVGAALLLDNDKIITGSNQENAAYPSGLCAERVAIFAAKSQYPEAKIISLVIVSSAKKIMEPVSPCGSCRQVLVEYEHLQKDSFDIYLQSKGDSIIKLTSAKTLLPFSFQSDMLHA